MNTLLIYSRQETPRTGSKAPRLARRRHGRRRRRERSGRHQRGLFTLAGRGDHLVSTASIYGGTRILFGRSFKRFGIDVDYVWNENDDAEVGARDSSDESDLPGQVPNPCNDVTDLRRIAEVAARHNLPLVVDNTVGTPALIRPFEHGANIVVHSTTKFLTVHGSAVGGAIIDGGNFDWAAAGAAGRSFPLITQSAGSVAPMLERFGTGAYARAARVRV